MATKREKIINRLSRYTGYEIEMAMRVDRQNRLKILVQQHDIESVALAGGLTVNTLKQYLRVKLPTSIAETTVVQAETILKGL